MTSTATDHAARATSSGARDYCELALQRLCENIDCDFLFTRTNIFHAYIYPCQFVCKKAPQSFMWCRYRFLIADVLMNDVILDNVSRAASFT